MHGRASSVVSSKPSMTLSGCRRTTDRLDLVIESVSKFRFRPVRAISEIRGQKGFRSQPALASSRHGGQSWLHGVPADGGMRRSGSELGSIKSRALVGGLYWPVMVEIIHVRHAAVKHVETVPDLEVG